jgi:hypothetical protein
VDLEEVVPQEIKLLAAVALAAVAVTQAAVAEITRLILRAAAVVPTSQMV